MKRNFDEWFQTFRRSINGYDYYTDFEKVYRNVEKVKVELNILNSLIGSKRIEDDFQRILVRYPECLKVIPLLLAVREQEIYCQDNRGPVSYRFDQPVQPIKSYQYFMRQTGLFNLLETHRISNLYDYVTGIEVGLDSNGRKNRGGHQMERLVESFLQKAGVEYFKELKLSEMERRWGVSLGAISAEGTSEKRWDFVVKTPSSLYVIETNFYASGGSKLNETARSYKMIAEEARSIPHFHFVWITDGGGWNDARGNLKETSQVMEHLYNISDMEHGIFLTLFR